MDSFYSFSGFVFDKLDIDSGEVRNFVRGKRTYIIAKNNSV